MVMVANTNRNNALFSYQGNRGRGRNNFTRGRGRNFNNGGRGNYNNAGGNSGNSLDISMAIILVISILLSLTINVQFARFVEKQAMLL